MLSKSKYTRGVRCEKSLWLYTHKYKERVVSESSAFVMSRGTDIGELARDFFPGGKLAVLEEFPGYAAAKRTQEFIKQGVEDIYEATFIADDVLVAVDILHKENGQYHLYEMKSTNSVKPEHYPDVAVQYYVLKRAGVDLGNAFLMHLNREYVRHGALDVQHLFVAEDITPNVLELQKQVATNLGRLKEVVKWEDEPLREMGDYCTCPYPCDYCDYCAKLMPPMEVPDKVLSSEPVIDQFAIQSFLDEVQYPLHYLDFETFMPALPMFDESHSYQQIPFQYSLHVQREPGGEIEHFEYLAPSDGAIDPRIGLIEQLIRDTAGAKTIIVYNIGFEPTRIREMAHDFPDYAKKLLCLPDLMLDLMVPFHRKHITTETMEGSYSIKKVLPALCPEFSYKDLPINNGGDASASFLATYDCQNPEEVKEIRNNLLKYCGLDTLAMVEILKKMKELTL